MRKERSSAVWRGDRPQRPGLRNDHWSMNFKSDQLVDNLRIRALNLIYDHTREGLAIQVDASSSGNWVCRFLDRILAERGHPKRVQTDNGPEFTGKALD